jgi:transcriptional regulator with XRE-family HTH domain
MEPFGEVIRARRQELRLSQAELAAAAGVHLRQIRRYETGEQQPVLAVAAKMATTLGITLDELAGLTGGRVRLEGSWWAAWEAGDTVVSHPVQLTQQASAIRIEAVRSEGPGSLWAGELQLWHDRVLTGHYAGADGSPRSKGTMFFVLDDEAERAQGLRAGLAYDGAIVSGRAALARERDAARAIVSRAGPSAPASPPTT